MNEKLKNYQVKLGAKKNYANLNMELTVNKKSKMLYQKQKPVLCFTSGIVFTEDKPNIASFYSSDTVWRTTEFPPFAMDEKLTSCNSMFYNMSGATSIDISQLRTPNVHDFTNMFSKMSELRSIDISNLDFSKVKNIQQIFMSCYKLNNIIGLENIQTKGVTSFVSCFNGCRALSGTLDLTNWDTSEATEMSSLFRYMSNIEVIDLTGWDTSKVESFTAMFEGCEKLKEVKGVLDISSMSTKYENFFSKTALSRITSLEKPIQVKNAPQGYTGIQYNGKTYVEVLSYKE